VRTLHPLAWWFWGISLAIATSRTVNVWLLLMIITATLIVTFSRRSQDPWASALTIGIKIACFALLIRMIIAILFSVPGDGKILFTLPRIQLPEWLAGIFLGGAVTSERLRFVLLESLVIFALVVTLAGASSLANPKQTLRSLPGVLHEAGVALIIATTLIPHFAMSVKRIRDARKMRGDTKRFSFKRSVIPLFEEALERALILAESMEARGYGYSHKSRNLEGKRNLAPTFIMLVGTGTLLLSILQMLIGAKYHVTLFIALGALGLGLTLGNKANSRSKYRPIPWRKEELLVITASLGAILITIIATKTFNALLALALLFACAAPLFVTSGRQRA
jgi:energy-coupling factor transport system permease protein